MSISNYSSKLLFYIVIMFTQNVFSYNNINTWKSCRASGIMAHLVIEVCNTTITQMRYDLLFNIFIEMKLNITEQDFFTYSN